MPVDTWNCTVAQDTDWGLGAGESYAHAVTGKNPLTNEYDLVGFATNLNVLPGLRLSGKTFTPALPNMTAIAQVRIAARVWKTAIYAGKYRWLIQLSNGLTATSDPVKPNSDASTDKYSPALSKPGGGSWTDEDLTGCIIGIETMGDGPWDGTDGSGGEIRAKYFRLEVDYTSDDPPIAEFSSDVTEVFEGGTVNFTDESQNAPTSWSWDFNEDASPDSILQDDSFVYVTQPAAPPNNAFDVSLTATNTEGSDTETKTDYIKVWKTTDNCIADFEADVLSGYAPLTVKFTDLSQVLVNDWDWDFGDGVGVSTDQNPTYIYNTPGTYDVSLDVDNGYTTDNETKVGYIEVLSAIPQFTISANPTSGQRPLEVQFTFNPSGGLVASSWVWDFGDGTGSVLENPVHTYKNPGTYTVSLTAGNEYGSDTVTEVDFITVTAIPLVVDFVANITKGLAPMTVRFRDLTTGDASSWLWDFGDSTPTSTERHPTHTYRSEGLYTVALTVNTGDPSEETETKIDYILVLDEDTGSTGGPTYLRFLWELQMHMMRPDDLTPCEAFEEFGGIDQVLSLINDRIARFQLETGTLKKEDTATLVSQSNYDLPQDLIELRRVEVDGVRIEPLDQYQMDRYNSVWEDSDSVSTDYLGYILEPSTEGLKLVLVPNRSFSPTVRVGYVYAPAEVIAPGDGLCGFGTNLWPPFPLPYVFWWIIRYGVQADLLKQEGELYDVSRAALCEQLWQAGVELVKLLHDSHGGNRG
jgi:PKD repeat protein